MHDSPAPTDKEEWVIWNGTSGFLMMATIGRVEVGTGSRIAWMDPPFEMLGPFNLDELETHGRIAFAACTILSRQRWQDEQMELRRESYEARRAAQERLDEQYARFNGGRRRRRTHRQQIDERRHRETLNLPIDGKLEITQIKKAYRRLAQKAHPDTGGSHEEFLRITQARNALLECLS
ncbi:heat shock protein DnaJ domain-containing protein [Methyloglobulus morosus KoM1]|uniref:Heat shock protein DnaJ domain-containing protein n=1 Tax=Methyloglobulus morosus KoM1 TaxID=1116472 RepID=V5CA78_9GAMM|nr:DnaJ domain-containing protein [Methyloglobulus morosus]ESS73713.1 heat shock protein DnaJ domain-containing protein [Methyloglobulus morosus KoM1]